MWNSFLGQPQKESIIAQVKDRLVDLLEHIHHCEPCGIVSQRTSDIPGVYRALTVATGGIQEEEKKFLEAELQAQAADIDRTARAVTEALLPTLPRHLSDLRELGVSPTDLFMAMDGVSMLLHRFERRNPSKGDDVSYLTSDGFFVRDVLQIPSETIVHQIMRVAEVDGSVAENLFRWVIEAGRSFPRLFLGALTKARPTGGVMIKLTERDPNLDLFAYWAPRQDETSSIEALTSAGLASASPNVVARESPLFAL
ncbi:MAG: hypothetical protein IT162_23525 [Bryobacterales bacterium]|nr:hypothetical protein [Bryobacterales bacterium]